MRSLTNEIILAGVFSESFMFSHETAGEKFYTAILNVERTSGTVDKIPVIAPERLVKDVKANVPVKISGQIRTHISKRENGSLKLNVFAFANEMDFLNEDSWGYKNGVVLFGNVKGIPQFRTTKSGRDIASFSILVKRKFGKVDSIPVIVWGRNARYAVGLEPGMEISVIGRLQSRHYVKFNEENNPENEVVYEVSVAKMMMGVPNENSKA